MNAEKIKAKFIKQKKDIYRNHGRIFMFQLFLILVSFFFVDVVKHYTKLLIAAILPCTSLS